MIANTVIDETTMVQYGVLPDSTPKWDYKQGRDEFFKKHTNYFKKQKPKHNTLIGVIFGALQSERKIIPQANLQRLCCRSKSTQELHSRLTSRMDEEELVSCQLICCLTTAYISSQALTRAPEPLCEFSTHSTACQPAPMGPRAAPGAAFCSAIDPYACSGCGQSDFFFAKKLQTAPITIQDISAKLNPNKENAVLPNKRSIISNQARDLIIRCSSYFNWYWRFFGAREIFSTQIFWYTT